MKQPCYRVIFTNEEYRYGFHVQKYPSLAYTVEHVAKSTPYTVFQTYLGNPRSSSVNNSSVEDILNARSLLKKYDLKMFVHGALTYNLCGSTNHKKDAQFSYNLKKTCDGLVNELDIVAGMEGSGVVVHPNSCHDVDKGLFTASKTVEAVLTRNTVLSGKISKKLNISLNDFKKKRSIILENSAHEGGKRGWSLEELSIIIKGVPLELQDQVGVCIDTAHAFGAGIYDFGKPSQVILFYKDFDRIIGLKHLRLFHLNDSMCSEKKANNAYFGSHKDRHQNLGLGYIFGNDVGGETEEGSRMNGLKEFFHQAEIHSIPIVGEPPSSSGGGEYDWFVVKNLLRDTKSPLQFEYDF